MGLASDLANLWKGGGGPHLARNWVNARGIDNETGWLAFAQDASVAELQRMTGDSWDKGSDRFMNLWRSFSYSVRVLHTTAARAWREENEPPPVPQPVEGPPDPPPPPPPAPPPEPEPEPPRNPDRGTPVQEQPRPDPLPPAVIYEEGTGPIQEPDPPEPPRPDPATLFREYMGGGNPTNTFWTLDKFEGAALQNEVSRNDFVDTVVSTVKTFGYIDVNEVHASVIVILNRISFRIQERLSRDLDKPLPEPPEAASDPIGEIGRAHV